ncbi:hypothetical protein RRG08_026258 [Elysia crispata]|uniref:Uncharacterized protein n=1 Tax=Elysia crispata TaxID=231223 RepID=A0AAE0ZAF9_9GAST|nr:hypothetical protein RRG08_026258 [Elysia crispata]
MWRVGLGEGGCNGESMFQPAYGQPDSITYQKVNMRCLLSSASRDAVYSLLVCASPSRCQQTPAVVTLASLCPSTALDTLVLLSA